MMVRVRPPHNRLETPAPDECRLDLLVEQICQLGCDAVNDIIAQIGQGQVPDAVRQLSAQQLQQLRLELQEIMAPLQH